MRSLGKIHPSYLTVRFLREPDVDDAKFPSINPPQKTFFIHMIPYHFVNEGEYLGDVSSYEQLFVGQVEIADKWLGFGPPEAMGDHVQIMFQSTHGVDRVGQTESAWATRLRNHG